VSKSYFNQSHDDCLVVYIIIESCLTRLLAISSEMAWCTAAKFGCRHVLSMCRTTTGSYVDRSNHCEENQHFIQVFERKQTCHKQLRALDGRLRSGRCSGPAAQQPRARHSRAMDFRIFQSTTWTKP